MSDSANARSKQMQRETWDAVSVAWERWWPIFEKAAGQLSHLMVEMGHIGAGMTVLDLATGIGEPALTVAAAVGSRGHVIATDHAPQMLALGRKRAAAANVHNIEFKEVDAEAPELQEQSFDAVTCRWGLMFLPDLESALVRIRKLLRPGGWLVAAVWAEAPKVPMISLSGEEVARALGLPPPKPGDPDPLRLADIAALETMFSKAGFTQTGHRRVTLPFVFPSAQAYAEFRLSVSGALRVRFESLSSGQIEAARQAIIREAEKRALPDGTISLPSESVCVAGRA